MKALAHVWYDLLCKLTAHKKYLKTKPQPNDYTKQQLKSSQIPSRPNKELQIADMESVCVCVQMHISMAEHRVMACDQWIMLGLTHLRLFVRVLGEQSISYGFP